MVEKPSHIKQLSLNPLCKTALKSENQFFLQAKRAIGSYQRREASCFI